MKNIIVFLFAVIAIMGCHGLNPTPVYPPHYEESLALNKSLRSKFIGKWEYVRSDSGHIDTIMIQLNADSTYRVKALYMKRDSIVKNGEVIYGDWHELYADKVYSIVGDKKEIWSLTVTDDGDALILNGYYESITVNGKKYGLSFPLLYFDGITDNELVMQKLFSGKKVTYKRIIE